MPGFFHGQTYLVIAGELQFAYVVKNPFQKLIGFLRAVKIAAEKDKFVTAHTADKICGPYGRPQNSGSFF